MLLGTVALVAAAMILASALPIFAKQVKTQVGGRQVEQEGTCTVLPGTAYPTIQSAVDDPSCQTVKLNSGFYIESVTIDRDVTILGYSDPSDPWPLAYVRGVPNRPVFTIGSGTTVTLVDVVITGGSGVLRGDETRGGGIYNEGTLVLEAVTVTDNKAEVGGGIYNKGTLTLGDGSSVQENFATKDGGGIYNEGALYLCGGTVRGNEAPRGTVNNISGNPAQECPTAPPPGGPPKEGEWVLVDHKGKKELCLPEAALNGHLKHGDEIISEEGCSDDTEGGGRKGLK